MADQLLIAQQALRTLAGAFAPGALARFYVPSTTTPKGVFTDATATVLHPVPLVADASGVFPQVFAEGATKVVVTDALGATLPGGVIDPAWLSPAVGAGAAQITFAPTPDIPADNVQTAIVAALASAISSMKAGGIGEAGSATALTNFDAADPASGFYRFETTTAGLRPTGWVGTETGYAVILPRSADERVMLIFESGANSAWYKRQVAGSWLTWVRVVDTGMIATLANAQTGTGTGIMTAERVKSAIDAQVNIGATIAAIPLGAVGSLAWLGRIAAGDIVPGAVHAAADLAYAGTVSAGIPSDSTAVSHAATALPAGSAWRSLGGTNFGGTRNAATLFVRIA